MQSQDKPDGNEPRRPVVAIQIWPPEGAVRRGRRRVRTRMTPRLYRPDPLPVQSSSSDESFVSSDADNFTTSGSLDSLYSSDALEYLSECSDFIRDYPESNSPTAPEDKIVVTTPPVKNSADLEEPQESDDTSAELTDENEKPTKNQGKSASKKTAKVQPIPRPAEVCDAGPSQESAAKRRKPEQSSSSDGSFVSSDADNFTTSGSIDSSYSKDNLEYFGEHSDFIADYPESNSPTDLEEEAPEDKIVVTTPPVKNSADLEEPQKSDDTSAELTDENEKPTKKSPEEIADKKTILEQELRDGSEGSAKKNKDLTFQEKRAILKRKHDIWWEKNIKDLNQGKPASKKTAKIQPKPRPVAVFDAGPAGEPAAKRRKESE